MTADTAVDILNLYFLRDYPKEAAREIEALPPATVIPVLAGQSPEILAGVWHYLLPNVAETLLMQLPDETIKGLLTVLDPGRAASLLDRLGKAQQAYCLELLAPAVTNELRQFLYYPQDSAGRMMDARVTTLRGDMSPFEALSYLRHNRETGRMHMLFLVDDEGRLEAALDMQTLALADSDKPIRKLARPVTASVSVLEPREEVAELLEQFHIEELPVLDINGRVLGVIRSEVLRQTMQDATSADLQTMVGVSRDERALSPPVFSARKRILWMHINLITAFMAASVVGLFESTIAQFTALAVLMPVVAGMGGNMGSQALAVTLRGLALREIGVRHWLKVFFKEVRVGLMNGTAIALTTALAVWWWSQNPGLALVIALAMLISLSIASITGAMVPILLTRFGLDPAQSSSILLTTVTDITGFMSFLGIATLLSHLLLIG